MDILFKFPSEDVAEFRAVARDSNELFTRGLIAMPIFSAKVDECRIFDTSLPVLYKQTKAGEWQEMRFQLVVGTEQGAQMVNAIECGDKEPRMYTSVIKPVPSKLYTVVMQERLIAKWVKKQDRDGWTIDKNTKVLGEPLLLHHWDLHKDKIRFPALISPKYNGIRCTFKYDKDEPKDSQLLSRKRLVFNIPDILAQLQVFGMSVDGELWAEGKELEDIVSMVAHGDRDLKYVLFDQPIDNPEITYPERLAKLLNTMKGGYYPNIIVAPVAVVNDAEEVEVFFQSIKTMPGVDGAVVRNMSFPYEFNVRSYDVQKVKDIISKEYTCNGMVFDIDPIGSLGKMQFWCKDTNTTFEYVPNRTKEQRRAMYQDYSKDPSQYIDHTYTLEFREYTKKGLPRHILTMTERNYE